MVDVFAVRADTYLSDLGSQFLKNMGSNCIGGTMGTVQNDMDAV